MDILQQPWPTVDPKYFQLPDIVEVSVLVSKCIFTSRVTNKICVIYLNTHHLKLTGEVCGYILDQKTPYFQGMFYFVAACHKNPLP